MSTDHCAIDVKSSKYYNCCQFIDSLKFAVTVIRSYKISYHFKLIQCDYHFVSTIDRHDVISGKVVAVVAKSLEDPKRARAIPGRTAMLAGPRFVCFRYPL